MPVGTQGQRSPRLLRPADATNEQVEIFLVGLRQIFRWATSAPQGQSGDMLANENARLDSRIKTICRGSRAESAALSAALRLQHSPFSALIWRAILQVVDGQDGGRGPCQSVFVMLAPA